MAELAAFTRALSADAVAAMSHAHSLGMLVAVEIGAAGRLAAITSAPIPVAAGAASARREPAQHNVTNHFHITGTSDPHATAHAVERITRTEAHRALHDGADG